MYLQNFHKRSLMPLFHMFPLFHIKQEAPILNGYPPHFSFFRKCLVLCCFEIKLLTQRIFESLIFFFFSIPFVELITQQTFITHKTISYHFYNEQLNHVNISSKYMAQNISQSQFLLFGVDYTKQIIFAFLSTLGS